MLIYNGTNHSENISGSGDSSHIDSNINNCDSNSNRFNNDKTIKSQNYRVSQQTLSSVITPSVIYKKTKKNQINRKNIQFLHSLGLIVNTKFK